MNISEVIGILVKRYSRGSSATRNKVSTVTGLVVALICILLQMSCNTTTKPSPTASWMPQFSVQKYYGPIDKPVSTLGCGRTTPVSPGTSTDVTLPAHPAESLGRSTRIYRVHVPKTYDMNHPQPVVLAFHGYGGNGAGMEQSTGFSTLADQQDFIAVYPQGLPDGVKSSPFWASVGPIDYGVDDTLFVSDVLNDLQSKFCVDFRRIYVTGFSNGGGMIGLLACKLAKRIAAFAPVSGNFYAIPGGCHPGRPVPILDFHGTNDSVLPYNGIPVSKNPAWPLPSIAQWLQTWASRDGCTSGPTIFLHQSNVVGEQWSGCQRNAAVIHYRIVGGGHAWPPTIEGLPGTTLIWHFFRDYSLPTAK